jgi:hypothetical protein
MKGDICFDPSCGYFHPMIRQICSNLAGCSDIMCEKIHASSAFLTFLQTHDNIIPVELKTQIQEFYHTFQDSVKLLRRKVKNSKLSFIEQDPHFGKLQFQVQQLTGFEDYLFSHFQNPSVHCISPAKLSRDINLFQKNSFSSLWTVRKQLDQSLQQSFQQNLCSQSFPPIIISTDVFETSLFIQFVSDFVLESEFIQNKSFYCVQSEHHFRSTHFCSDSIVVFSEYNFYLFLKSLFSTGSVLNPGFLGTIIFSVDYHSTYYRLISLLLKELSAKNSTNFQSVFICAENEMYPVLSTELISTNLSSTAIQLYLKNTNYISPLSVIYESNVVNHKNLCRYDDEEIQMVEMRKFVKWVADSIIHSHDKDVFICLLPCERLIALARICLRDVFPSQKIFFLQQLRFEDLGKIGSFNDFGNVNVFDFGMVVSNDYNSKFSFHYEKIDLLSVEFSSRRISLF